MKNSFKLHATLLKDLSVGGLLVAIAITSLNAGVTFTNPLGSNFKSTDNGGTLPAIDAYKDGIGVIVLDNLGIGVKIDNSAMNTLVYKYGETAKTNNTTIANEVINGSGSTNVKDKELATNINNLVSGTLAANINGTACNDNNSATTGETWLNNVCQGGSVITSNVTSTGIIYDNCEGGMKTFSEASLYCSSKGMRIPSFGESISMNTEVSTCTASIYIWAADPYPYGGHYLYDQHVQWWAFADDNTANISVRCIK